MKATLHKTKTAMMLVIQAIILITTALTAVTGVLYGASSNQDGDDMIGLGYFKAFTMDSNVLAGICSLFVVCYAIKSLIKREDTTPRWVHLFQLATTTCLFLTFVTVVLFLAPMDVLEGKSYLGMFSNDLFFFHLTNPVLAILSFVFLSGECKFERKDCIWGMVPVAVYVLVYFLMVVVLGQWRDFYGFSFGGRYYLVPVVIAAMLALTYLLCWALMRMNAKFAGKASSGC